MPSVEKAHGHRGPRWPGGSSRPQRSESRAGTRPQPPASHPPCPTPHPETFPLSKEGRAQGSPPCPAPALQAPSHQTPASTASPIRHPPSTSPPPSTLSPLVCSSAKQSAGLRCYAQRSLIHYLSPPSVWERLGAGREGAGPGGRAVNRLLSGF